MWEQRDGKDEYLPVLPPATEREKSPRLRISTYGDDDGTVGCPKSEYSSGHRRSIQFGSANLVRTSSSTRSCGVSAPSMGRPKGSQAERIASTSVPRGRSRLARNSSCRRFSR